MNDSLLKYLTKDGSKINPNIRKLIIKNKDESLFSSLAKKYNLPPNLDDLSTLQLSQIFWHEQNSPQVGECLTCSTPVKFISLKTGWLKFCNSSCQMKHPDQQTLRLLDAQKRFNVNSYLQSTDKLSKVRQTDEFKTRHKTGIIKSWVNNKEARVAKMLASRLNSENPYWSNRFRDKLIRLKELEFSIIESQPNGKPLLIEHKCGQRQPYGRWSRDTYLCIACSPNPRIKSESAMLDEIQSVIGKEIQRNAHFGKIKVDGLIVGTNLAIDYNGLFWHSSAAEDAGFGSYNAMYHTSRREILAEQHNIKLIQVFEDEWLNKKNIILNRIVHLTKQSNKVMARKCEIVDLDYASAKAFLNENHIAGSVPFKHAFGLAFNNQLVAVSTFGKNRYSNVDCLELLRFCSTGSVVGGLGRLVNYAIKKFNHDVLSYSDNLWGDGAGYESAGFKLEKEVKPGYFYFDKKNFSRVSRQAFSRNNFIKTFGKKYDSTLSERDNAKLVNCFIVHDAGKKRWIKHK